MQEVLYEDLNITDEPADKLPDSILYPDYHLNVPLRSKFFEWYYMYHNKYENFCKLPRYRQTKIVKFCDQANSILFHNLINKEGKKLPLFIDPATIFSKFFIYWSSHEWNRGATEKSIIEDYSTVLDSAWDLFHIQENSLEIPSNLEEHHTKDWFKQSIVNHSIIAPVLFASVFMRSLVISMNQIGSKADQNSSMDYKCIQDRHVTVLHSSKNLSACTAGEGACLFLNGEMLNLNKEGLLCLSDLVHQRLNVYLASYLGNTFRLPQYPSVYHLQHVLDWGDQVLLLRQQDGYTIVKNLEAICVSILIERRQENICDNLKFWDGILNDFREKQDLEAINYLQALKNYIQPFNNNIVSQFFGMFRLWDHPLVDTVANIYKVKKAACAVTAENKELANDILYMFRILFINGFIDKLGIWPNIRLLNPSPYLKFQSENNLKIDYHSPSFKLTDMKQIELTHNLYADPSFNMATMMSDKALSLGMRELLETYRRTKGIGKASLRRVILEWLKSDVVSASDLLNIIDEHGFDDNKIIGVVPKERELKVEPRLFAIMTLMARLYFVVTESLIGDHLLQYFPQIAMGLEEIELNKRKYDITKNQKRQGGSMFKESITQGFDSNYITTRIKTRS